MKGDIVKDHFDDNIMELLGALQVLKMELDSYLHDDQLDSDCTRAASQILRVLGHPPDLVHRQITFSRLSVHLLYFSVGADDQLITMGILEPLLRAWHDKTPDPGASTALGAAAIAPQDVAVGQASKVDTVHAATEALLQNQALLGVSQWTSWWAFDVASPPVRSATEPPNATVIHGPHEGFVENMATNLTLLRQFVQTPYLRIKKVSLGFWSKNTIAIIYLQGITPASLVRWAHQRLNSMDIRGLVDSSRIAMALGGPPVIPSLQYSERPDQVAAALFQGRLAIMMDQSPAVLLAPARLSDLMTRPGDYYELPLTSSITRLLRYVGLLAATTLPATYVAALTVNPSFIPLALWLTTIRTRLAIPFPVLVETTLMLLVVDVVQEAGIIMPGALGQTVTIFGGLILGDAAIKAGVVSAPTLITVTLAMLAQFLIPDANLMGAARLIRYALILPAAIFGFTGIVSSWMVLLGLAVRFDSAHYPYLSPLAPWRPGGWRDSIFRLPGRGRNRQGGRQVRPS